MATTGIADVCPLDDKDRIKVALLAFLEKLSRGEPARLTEEQVQGYSRQHQAARFQKLLDATSAS